MRIMESPDHAMDYSIPKQAQDYSESQFLTIPLEIRIRIYTLTFCDHLISVNDPAIIGVRDTRLANYLIVEPGPTYFIVPSRYLLQTCKRVRDEVIAFYMKSIKAIVFAGIIDYYTRKVCMDLVPKTYLEHVEFLVAGDAALLSGNVVEFSKGLLSLKSVLMVDSCGFLEDAIRSDELLEYEGAERDVIEYLDPTQSFDAWKSGNVQLIAITRCEKDDEPGSMVWKFLTLHDSAFSLTIT